jgi:hypothetical protein
VSKLAFEEVGSDVLVTASPRTALTEPGNCGTIGPTGMGPHPPELWLGQAHREVRSDDDDTMP